MRVRVGIPAYDENGEHYWLIPLTRGKFAMVDDCDYPELSKCNWHTLVCGSICYAIRGLEGVLMHRQILEPEAGVPVDHKDGNGLNNRRGNLRTCTPSQNIANSRISKRTHSGFKGVSWHKGDRAWHVIVCQHRKNIYVGAFKDIIAAALAYNRVASEVHGEFAKLNEIPALQTT